MHALQTFMSSLSIGSPTSWEGLTGYPLLRPTAPEPFYDTLSEAIRGGTLHISEVSESGSVPELRVVNDGARPVLSLHQHLPAWRGLVPLVRGAHGVLELPAGTIAATGTLVGDRLLLA